MFTPVAMVFTLGYDLIQFFLFYFFWSILILFKMYSYPYCGATISCAEYFKKNTWMETARLAMDYSSNQVIGAPSSFTKGYNYLPIHDWNRKLLKKGNLAYAYLGLITKIAWDTTGTAPYSDNASK